MRRFGIAAINLTCVKKQHNTTTTTTTTTKRIHIRKQCITYLTTAGIEVAPHYHQLLVYCRSSCRMSVRTTPSAGGVFAVAVGSTDQAVLKHTQPNVQNTVPQFEMMVFDAGPHEFRLVFRAISSIAFCTTCCITCMSIPSCW